MQTMRERIARTIYRKMNGFSYPGSSILSDAEERACRAVGAAYAALEEMREPTEGMLAAGQLLHWGSPYESTDEEERGNCLQIFEAMIDHARKEEG